MTFTNRISTTALMFGLLALPVAVSAANVSLYGATDVSLPGVGASSTTQVEMGVTSPITVTASDAADTSVAVTSSSEVQTSDDFSAYAKSEMRGDANLREVSATSDSFTLRYREPARFLGIFPTSLTVTALVHADGSVEVSYPWYRFLMAAPHESDIKAAIQTETAISPSTSFSASTEAAILAHTRVAVAKIRSAAEGGASVNATTNTSAY